MWLRLRIMASKREVLRQQRRWAEAAGLTVDNRGYLEDAELNLRVPLSRRAGAAFAEGSGSELLGQGTRPPKMCALHSSAALAANVFDHWTDRDAAPLQRALEIDSEIVSIAFERKFDTGLRGSPPNLDVAFELASGAVVGIESKFTEWLTPKRASRQPFKDKYFEGGTERWAAQGLEKCQGLASGMMAGEIVFRHLDAAQLLKHALGLATQRPACGHLRYLFLDLPCPSSDQHLEELERFAGGVDETLDFRGGPYQALVTQLHADATVDAGYVSYLRSRYCDAFAL